MPKTRERIESTYYDINKKVDKDKINTKLFYNNLNGFWSLVINEDDKERTTITFGISDLISHTLESGEVALNIRLKMKELDNKTSRVFRANCYNFISEKGIEKLVPVEEVATLLIEEYHATEGMRAIIQYTLEEKMIMAKKGRMNSFD